jgi:(p)ppGpp synthase/HD superfamily hydrolase
MTRKEFVDHVNTRRRGKMSQLEYEMALFAFDCHNGMTRKFDYEPYICHPAEVACIVSQVSNEPEALAAAWGHDVVEDCGVDIGLIRAQFGDKVADYIGFLTNPSQIVPELKKLNREKRKAADRDHLLNAPDSAKTVKLADILSNINSLVYNDPLFAAVWIREKEQIMPLLEGGNSRLYALVHSNIIGSKSYLRI